VDSFELAALCDDGTVSPPLSLRWQYVKAGAHIVDSTVAWTRSDVVMKVRPPSIGEAQLLGDRQVAGRIQIM
jgi:NAD/NADP transhydrogenase alpha subunit